MPSTATYLSMLANKESRKAIELLIEDANTLSWDAALISAYTVRLESLSVHEIRCCRACNQGRLTALLGRLVRSLWSLSCCGCGEAAESGTRLRYLNHLKILSRLMPVLLEDPSDVGVQHMLWSSQPTPPIPEAVGACEGAPAALSEQLHSLGGCLLHAVLRSFFVKGFTLLAADDEAPANPWSFSSAAADEARTQAMQALIACCSASLYVPPASLAAMPNRMLLAASAAPEPHGKALFRALLSVTFSYDPVGWGLPYSHSIVTDSHAEVMHTSSQLLLVLLSQGDQPPPVGGAPSPADKMSRLLAGLQRDESLNFIIEGFARLLRTSFMAQSSFLPSSMAQIDCEQELILLLWKFMCGNHAFLTALLRSSLVSDVLLSLCHFIFTWIDEVSRPSLVHLCMLCLLLLSSEKDFHPLVNSPCPHTLPRRGRTSAACAGSIADLLTACVCEVLLSGHERLECVFPAGLALLSNLAPHTRHCSYTSANLLLCTLTTFAAPSFVLAAPKRADHLVALVDVLASYLLYQRTTNLTLLQVLLLNAPVVDAIRRIRVSEEAPTAAADGFAPTNAWIDEWQARLNLRPLQLLFDEMLPKLSAEELQQDAVPQRLRSTSLAAVLPPAPPITVRCYQPDDYSHVWLTQVIWGVVYSRNQSLFDARSVRLVQIMQLD